MVYAFGVQVLHKATVLWVTCCVCDHRAVVSNRTVLLFTEQSRMQPAITLDSPTFERWNTELTMVLVLYLEGLPVHRKSLI